MNAKQTKYIYDILGGDDGRKLYDAVQKAIDKAKTLGADIIIGLGHLGVDPSSSPGPVRKSLPTPPALTPSSTATLTPSWRTNRSTMQPARLSP